MTVQGAAHPSPAYEELKRHVYQCQTCMAGRERCEAAWALVRQVRREMRVTGGESGQAGG